jgi:addiction module RelE/StbE family toxin
MAKHFTLRYSPLFYDDLSKIIDYIRLELKNVTAAKKLINDIEAAIKQRQARPLQSATYKSISKRRHPYRRIIVGNFLIFYVVIDDVMIIRRMLYGRRDIRKIL